MRAKRLCNTKADYPTIMAHFEDALQALMNTCPGLYRNPAMQSAFGAVNSFIRQPVTADDRNPILVKASEPINNMKAYFKEEGERRSVRYCTAARKKTQATGAVSKAKEEVESAKHDLWLLEEKLAAAKEKVDSKLDHLQDCEDEDERMDAEVSNAKASWNKLDD